MNKQIDPGRLLKALREQRALSQEQLAEKTNLALSTVQKIEQGTRSLTPTNATLIRTTLQLTNGEWQELERALSESNLSLSLTEANYKIPWVGRQIELAKLHEIWKNVQQGQARFVLIVGEAGIGKTRLASTFLAEIKSDLRVMLQSACIQKTWSYQPVKEWLKLEPLVLSWIYANNDIRAASANLRPELKDKSLPEASSPEKITSGLAHLFVAAGLPAGFFVDDLQWCDSATLNLLGYLLHNFAQYPILVISTIRQEDFTDQFMRELTTIVSQRQLDIITLANLTTDETFELAKAVNVSINECDAHELCKRCGGNPLFTIEVLRANKIASIPDSIRDFFWGIAVHLSSDALELAEVAAIVGQSFPLQLLIYATGWDETKVRQKLTELIDRRFITNLLSEQDVYDFSHVLKREAIDANIKPAWRSYRHKQVIKALENLYKDNRSDIINRLAHHYRSANQLSDAIEAYLVAGMIEHTKFVYINAIEFLNKGIELLPKLSNDPALFRLKLGLELYLKLGAALVAYRGNASDEVGNTYKKVRDLWIELTEIEKTPFPLPLIWGLGSHYMVRAELRQALEWGEQCLTIAQDLQDPKYLLDAHALLGLTQFYRGEFAKALQHLEIGEDLYDPTLSRQSVFDYVQDLGIFCVSYIGLVQWSLGYPEKASTFAETALKFAPTEKEDPNSHVVVLFFFTWLSYLNRNHEATKHWGQMLVTLTKRYNLRLWDVLGRSLVDKANFDENPTQILAKQLDGVEEDYQNTGAQLSLTFWLTTMADVYRKLGEVERAKEFLERALQRAETYEDRFWLAELYRLRGELALLPPAIDFVAATADFEQAISIAKGQEAKMMQLRATISLSSLLNKIGAPQEAYKRLDAIYQTFKEGRNNPDLQDAEILLTELSAGVSQFT